MNIFKKIKEKNAAKEEAIRKQVEEHQEKERQEQAEFQNVLDNIDKGLCLIYDGKQVNLVEEIDPNDYGIMIPKTQVMRGQILYPFELCQYKTVTKKINHAGPRARIKIAKGISYNVGSTNVDVKKSEVLSPLGKGQLFVTNKNIIHDGDIKVTKIPLNKIIGLGVDGDSIIIRKDTGKPLTILMPNKMAIMLNNLINTVMDEM